jgi:hypothetical protein
LMTVDLLPPKAPSNNATGLDVAIGILYFLYYGCAPVFFTKDYFSHRLITLL